MSKIINENDFNEVIKNLRAEGIEPFPFITPDFNFSAKFYAGWLRWLFANMEAIKIVISQLLKREIDTSTTDSIILSQDGDWTTEFLITLAAVLKVSKETTHIVLKDKDGNDVDFELQNVIEIFKDGAYVADLRALITYLNDGNNQLLNTDVGNHLSLSEDKNTLSLTRKSLDGEVLESDDVVVNLGSISDVIFSVIKFDYTVIDPKVTIFMKKGEITNAGFVDIRLELDVIEDLPAGENNLVSIDEPRAQPVGSIINGVVVESGTYKLLGGAAVRGDTDITIHNEAVIPAGSRIHLTFAYRNFNATIDSEEKI